jgi:hypothetical protein
VKAIAFFDGRRGYLAIHDKVRGIIEFVTTPAWSGHNIRVDDGRKFPHLYKGGESRGRALEWAQDTKLMGPRFARDCGARFYKNRDAYEGGFERMKADFD